MNVPSPALIIITIGYEYLSPSLSYFFLASVFYPFALPILVPSPRYDGFF
jgi:hypothetical protein